MAEISMRRRIIVIAVAALLAVAADQAAKWWARSSLKGRDPIVLVKGYLELEYHENPGSAFGLLRNVPGARYILIGVGVAALVLVGSMVRKVERLHGWADTGFGLVLGGALGNIADRIYLGRVVDFILMHWQRKYTWPAYNVADAVLVAGVALLILVLGRKPEGARAAEGKASRRKRK
jgi:signal peptidase II